MQGGGELSDARPVSGVDGEGEKNSASVGGMEGDEEDDDCEDVEDVIGPLATALHSERTGPVFPAAPQHFMPRDIDGKAGGDNSPAQTEAETAPFRGRGSASPAGWTMQSPDLRALHEAHAARQRQAPHPLAKNPVVTNIATMSRILQLREELQSLRDSRTSASNNKRNQPMSHQPSDTASPSAAESMSNLAAMLLRQDTTTNPYEDRCATLRSAIAALVAHAGFSSVSTHALNVLEEMTAGFVTSICQLTRLLKDHYHSTTSDKTLVAAAVRESVPRGLHGLERYVADDVKSFGKQLLEVESNLQRAIHDVRQTQRVGAHATSATKPQALHKGVTVKEEEDEGAANTVEHKAPVLGSLHDVAERSSETAVLTELIATDDDTQQVPEPVLQRVLNPGETIAAAESKPWTVTVRKYRVPGWPEFTASRQIGLLQTPPSSSSS